ncbi:MAG: hypothetical protein V1495_10630 [Pseudomonadota bacterium]
MRRQFLLATVFCSAALAIVLASYDAAFYFRTFSQFFASGLTFFKEYLFLLWGTLLFTLLASPLRIKPKKGIWVWGSILLAQGLVLVAQIYYSEQTRTQFGTSTTLVSGISFSQNRLTHLHVGKAMLTFLFRTIGISIGSPPLDTGAPFQAILPPPLVGLMLVFSIVSLVLIVVAILGKKEVWSGRQYWWCWIGLVVSSFAVLRSMIDGGPFSSEFLVYLPLFLLLLLGVPDSPLSLVRKLVPWWVAGFILLVGVTHLSGGRIGHGLFLRHVFFIVFCPTLLLLTDFLTSGRFVRRQLNLLWLIPILIVMNTGRFWGKSLCYFHTNLPAGTLVRIAIWNRMIPLHALATEGPLTIYEIRLSTATTIGTIHKMYGIPPGYEVVAAEGRNCETSAFGRNKGRITILAARPESTPPLPPVFRSFTLEPCRADERCNRHFETVINGCMPGGSYQLSIARLISMGFESFVVSSDR